VSQTPKQVLQNFKFTQEEISSTKDEGLLEKMSRTAVLLGKRNAGLKQANNGMHICMYVCM